MAVYKKTYRPYDGGLTSSWTRVLVIPRYAFEDLHRSRFLTNLLHCQLHLPADLRAHHLRAAQRQRAGPGGGAGRQPADFDQRDVLHVGARMARACWRCFLAAFIGPGQVSPDLANNALSLYLRPALFARRVRIGQALRPGHPDVADDLGAGPAAVRARGLSRRLRLDAG